MRHVTKNDVHAIRDRVYSVPYCELQTILNYWEKSGYNSGVYGWNFDLYVFPDLAIVTGYRNLTGTPIPRDILERYEHNARKNPQHIAYITGKLFEELSTL